MLLRLLPEQVARYWDIIKPGIEKALPPVAGESADKMNNILGAILGGGMVCWLIYRKLEEGIEVTGFMVTTIAVDSCTITNSLLIYVIFAAKGRSIGGDGWAEGYEALSKYGKSVGCSRITGYTDVDYVCKIAEKLGGESKYRFVSVPIE